MKQIMFCSIVRDGVKYLDNYFNQLITVGATYGTTITLSICEGDSTDGTYEFIKSRETHLLNNGVILNLYQFNHNGLKYGSVNNPDRWANIARTWNYMLDALPKHNNEACIYMESDLIFTPDVIQRLVSGLSKYDAIAPMSMTSTGKGKFRFYDIWGHRRNEIHFTTHYPYHPEFDLYDDYMPINSAGSCVAMKPEVLSRCRLSLVDAMIGHDIVKYGYTFVLDKLSRVIHP